MPGLWTCDWTAVRRRNKGGIVVKFLPRPKVAGNTLQITAGIPDENNALLVKIELFQEGERL